mmetsp:Transcript_68610/g.134781  ORF Transcript_68610/g.134781 Transcript_68610/m.134781 type:complete len:203 (+) Transcript_68610:56-664(+)
MERHSDGDASRGQPLDSDRVLRGGGGAFECFGHRAVAGRCSAAMGEGLPVGQRLALGLHGEEGTRQGGDAPHAEDEHAPKEVEAARQLEDERRCDRAQTSGGGTEAHSRVPHRSGEDLRRVHHCDDEVRQRHEFDQRRAHCVQCGRRRAHESEGQQPTEKGQARQRRNIADRLSLGDRDCDDNTRKRDERDQHHLHPNGHRR